MKKKVLMTMFAGMMAVSMLTACGGNKADTSKTDNAASVESEKKDSTEKEEEASDTAEAEDETDVSDTAEAETDVSDSEGESGDAGDFSLLDVSADMIQAGAYGTDSDGTEVVFAMFQGPDGENYASLFGFDNNSGGGDVICGTYDAETETDEDGIAWTVLDVHDVYTGETVRLGTAEKDGEIMFYDEDGNIVEGKNLDADETINYMGSAAAILQQSEE